MKTPHRLASIWAVACTLLLTWVSVNDAIAQGAANISVIELKHRRADELIPVLKPLVGPTTALTGMDYKLIVRSNETDLRRIREALAVLDEAPEQLLLSVRSANSAEIENDQAQLSGQIGNNTNITVQTGNNHSDNSGNNISTLRISEGQSAYIANGRLVPFAAQIVTQPITGTNQVNVPSNRVIVQQRQIGTGIEVRARVSGSVVIVDIEMQQDQMAGSNVAVNHVISQVSGKLGQWLPLSQVDNSMRESRSTLTGTTVRTSNDLRSLWIKVETAAE